MVHERLDQPDLLLVALRQLADRLVERQPEALGELGDVRVVDAAAQAREIAQHLAGGELLVQRQLAGEVAQPAAHGDPLPADVHAQNLRTAARGPQEVEQQADRRRLAGTVRADVAEDLAGPDLEIEVVERPERPVGLGEALGADRHLHGTGVQRRGSRSCRLVGPLQADSGLQRDAQGPTPPIRSIR
jgi:hypothetical protein